MDNTHYAQKVFAMREAQTAYHLATHDPKVRGKAFDDLFIEMQRLMDEVDELTTQILTPPQALKVSEINFMDATDSK